MPRAPLPAALDRRGEQQRLLHRPRRDWAGARLFLLRGRARLRSAAKLLTRDEARRLAVNFAKLPEMMRRSPPGSEA